MMNSENAIEIEDIWKSYRTGAIRGQTLMRQIESRIALVLGKQDPNSKILQREELTSQTAEKNQKFWAVRGVGFSVKKGEVVALLGRNGAGKSTLLQILCRITEADRGVVRVRGKVASLLGAGVGFNDEMTGRENVYLNGSILGMTPDQIAEKIEDIANFAEIPQFLDTPVKRYSSGMRSRLGFSVAVHLDCDIMILDEVFAAGDRVFRLKCIERMRELAGSGRTILIVTHMPKLLTGICERGIVLRNGRRIFDGDLAHAVDLYLEKESRECLSQSSNSMECDTEASCIIQNIQLSFFDRNSQVVDCVVPNTPLKLEISFDVLKNLKDLEVRILFRVKSHGAVIKLSSRENCRWSLGIGDRSNVELLIRRFPLVPETETIEYAIKIICYVGGVRLLIGEKNGELNVINNTPLIYPGLVICDASWNMNSKEKED
ncbi:MAG: ABC transporter ATP-binding protein [Puniceicoccaceae bacterium]